MLKTQNLNYKNRFQRSRFATSSSRYPLQHAKADGVDPLEKLLAVGASAAVIARLLPGRLTDDQLRALPLRKFGVRLGLEVCEH